MTINVNWGATNYRRGFMFGPIDAPDGRAKVSFFIDTAKPTFGNMLGCFNDYLDAVPGTPLGDYYYEMYRYAFHHSGKTANVLYMDGHVGAVKHFIQTGKIVCNQAWYSPPS
ncbi:MAG: hypothetical protein HY360_18870 [Verrucomicrobia bacterium]|nr:hypothetical protein [Verrucomicrobiota bacterium]